MVMQTGYIFSGKDKQARKQWRNISRLYIISSTTGGKENRKRKIVSPKILPLAAQPPGCLESALHRKLVDLLREWYLLACHRGQKM